MTKVTRHAIRVYAAVSALKGDNGDVLDALIPFFSPILQLLDQKVFDPKAFAAGVRRLYGWNFTAEVVEMFVPRLESRGYLKRLATQNGSTAYGVVFSEGGNADPSDSGIVAVFEEVLDLFVAFPAVVTDLLHYKLDREQLADILLRFLIETRSLPIQRKEDQTEDAMEEGGRALDEEHQYLAARFVQHLTDERPDVVDQLARIASIGLLAEVVDEFSRPINVPKNVQLSIYLDAPVALDYLGLSGKAIGSDVAAVLDSLQGIGCRLFVFPITCAEMSLNLNSMLALPAPKRHGYTHEAMLKGDVVLDYVRAVAHAPDVALKTKGVDVKNVDINSVPSQHKYFSKERFEDFLSAVYWVRDILPREHDASCLTYVMRLREGRQSADVFNTKHIFVTRNGAFAGFSRKYVIESQLLHAFQEGPIIHQRELATIAWLRTGLGEAKAIPRAHLIASCERILRVRPEVVDAIRDKVAGVSGKTEQLELLLQDYRSVRKLADETLNDERLVTADNAEHLLELMRKATAAEVEEEYRRKIEDERARHKAEIAEAKRRYHTERSIVVEQSQALVQAAEILTERTSDARQREGRIVEGMIGSINSSLSAAGVGLTALLLLAGLVAVANLMTEW